MNAVDKPSVPWPRWNTVLAILILLTISTLGLLNLRRHSSPPPKRAFYYWKTQWPDSSRLTAALKTNNADRLYVRFFDVGWDETAKAAHPVSPIELKSPLPDGVEIVPVVFLVNSVFLNIPAKDIDTLADRVAQRVEGMAMQQAVSFNEMQIDCDWSDGSRKSYFRFAERLHKKLKAANRTLSATLRLHQIKYKDRTGIPPVDRGMLMFYNFGKIEADRPTSAIFNESDAAPYVTYIAGYPFSLDVALPLFSWSVHSRDGGVVGLMEKIGSRELAAFDGFRGIGPNRYTAARSFFFRGSYFREGDRVLVDETTPETARQAAMLARRNMGSQGYGTVALFDLDERHMENYAKDKITPVWAAFQ